MSHTPTRALAALCAPGPGKTVEEFPDVEIAAVDAPGRRLLHGHEDVQSLELVDSEVTEKGNLLLTYRPRARH